MGGEWGGDRVGMGQGMGQGRAGGGRRWGGDGARLGRGSRWVWGRVVMGVGGGAAGAGQGRGGGWQGGAQAEEGLAGGRVGEGAVRALREGRERFRVSAGRCPDQGTSAIATARPGGLPGRREACHPPRPHLTCASDTRRSAE